KNGNETTPLAMATSDAMGNYTMTVATGGQPVDGFLKATAMSYMTIYEYPAGAYIADVMKADINMITQGNFNALSTIAGGNQMMGMGFVAAVVTDSTGKAVAGAAVATTPA